MKIPREGQHEYVINGSIATVSIERRNGQKYQFLVDLDDLSKVLEHKWCTVGRNRNYLVATINNKKKYLHHFISGNSKKGVVIDHRDRNPLNNSKKNLFHVSRNSNSTNRKITNRYGFPGITYLPHHHTSWKGTRSKNAWVARIRITKNKKTKLLHLGVFKTKEMAILARKKAEITHHGNTFH